MKVNEKISSNVLRNRYVFAIAFSALIAVSNFFIVPLPGGIPIVLKNMFVILSGTVLGRFYGGISALILITAGLIGLPVFAIPGGFGVFLTPLGGYIIGYFFAGLCSGLIAGVPKNSEKKICLVFIVRLSIASFSGFVLILLSGSLYLVFLNSMSLKAALAAGFLPFLLGDTIKLIISIPLALKLRPIAARFLNPGE